MKSFAGWKKTYKRECYLGETSVSLRLAQVLEPSWECKFSPGQYAPKPGELQVWSWEVDDQKRGEEDDAGANLRMRRGRFVNDKVDMGV